MIILKEEKEKVFRTKRPPRLEKLIENKHTHRGAGTRSNKSIGRSRMRQFLKQQETSAAFHAEERHAQINQSARASV